MKNFSQSTKTILNAQGRLERSRYVECIYKYSLPPVLFLLKEYEDEEQYEKCMVIKEAIEEYRSYKENEGLNIPTHIDQYSNDKWDELFSQIGDAAEDIKENNDYYIKEIKNKVYGKL